MSRSVKSFRADDEEWNRLRSHLGMADTQSDTEVIRRCMEIALYPQQQLKLFAEEKARQQRELKEIIEKQKDELIKLQTEIEGLYYVLDTPIVVTEGLYVNGEFAPMRQVEMTLDEYYEYMRNKGERE